MPVLQHNNRQLHYTDNGSGPALVFIHGFCEDSGMWDGLAGHFKDRYRVICVDLPGFGRSDVANDITIKGMAEAVHAVVEALQPGPVALLGHSMGGYTALAYAEAWPEQVSALGLIHSHPFTDSEEKKEGRAKSMEFVERNGSEPYVKQLIPSLFAPAFSEKNKTLLQALTERAAQYPPEGICAALDAMRLRPDRSEVLRTAAFPVLFVIGTEDQAIPAELSKQQTALPPVASIHYLEGVGHMGMFEAEEEVLDILGAFLLEHGTWSVEGL
jgi:pimeloyl-ACP methyl ester carboxylesterase